MSRYLITRFALSVAFFVVTLSFYVSSVYASVGINQTINFQGKLVGSNGLNVANGNYDVVFTLYDDPTTGSQIWTETWNSGTSQVSVTDGIFRVALGTHSSMSGVDFNQDAMYLAVKVGADAYMTPRIRFTSVPYAFVAKTVVNDALDFAQLEDSLDLDASTSITADGAEVLSIVNTGSGNSFLVEDQSTDSTPFVIDASGNVGIGTTSPLGPLTVRVESGKYFTMAMDNYSNPTWFSGDASSDQSTGMNFQVGSVGTLSLAKGSGFQLYGNTQDGPNFAGGIVFSTSTANLLNASNNAIIFRTGTSNTERLRIDKSGNVGIGTTTPTQKLDVSGNLQFSGAVMPGGNAGTSGYYLQSQGAGVAPTWTNLSSALLPSGTEGQTLYNNAGTWTANSGLFYDDLNSRVGIGTTNPLSPLHIIASNGTVTFRVTNTAGDGGVISNDATTTYFQALTSGNFARDFNISGRNLIMRTGDPAYSEAFRITSGGNVGIGTTSPEALLEVQGTEATNAVLALDADDGDDVADTWFLTSVASSNNLTFNNDTSAIAYLKSSGQSGGLLAIDLSTAAPSTCTEGEIYTNDTDGNIYYCTATDTWVDLTAQGGSSLWSGLLAPTANLTLAMSTYTTEFNWDTGTSTNDLFSLTTDASSNGTGSLLNIQTGSSSTVNPLRVRAGSVESLFVNTSGNVGIGTTSPKRELDISGDVWVGENSSVTNPDGNAATFFTVGSSTTNSQGEFSLVSNTSTTNGGYAGIFNFANYANGATDKRLAVIAGATDGAINSGRLEFFTYNAGTIGERMRITNAGDVGIGTTSPGAKLDISSPNTTTGIILRNSSNSNRVLGSLTNIANNGALILRDSSEVIGVNLLASGVSYLNGGNVGIGTTNPQAKLEVAGDVKFLGSNPTTLTFGSTAANAVINSPATFNINLDSTSSYSDALAFIIAKDRNNLSGGTELFRVQESGNVGIGTTSPEVLLEVQGTEATNAVLALDADDGDDVADTWFLTSVASSNNLTFNNDTSAIAYLKSSGQSGGLLAIDLSTAAPSTCTEGEIYTNDTDGNIYYCTATDTWVDLTAQGGSSLWSGLLAPTANLTLAMSTYTTEFNWDTGTSTNDLFSLTTDASSNGTGSLLNIQTGSSSTVNPLRVRAGSVESLFVNTSGNVGIGTTVPSALFNIAASNSSRASIKIDSSSTPPSSPSDGDIYYDTAKDSLMLYTGGKWQADRSTATLIVAASDSLYKEKADYVADGTDDQVEIESAISAIPAGGGTIVLTEGTFSLGDDITITKSNVKIVGSGAATILSKAWDQTTAESKGVITLGEDTNTYSGIEIRSMTLLGNKATYTDVDNYGVYIAGKVNESTVSNVIINNFAGAGIYSKGLGETNTGNAYINNIIKNGDSYGIYLSYNNRKTLISGNYIFSNGVSGIYLRYDEDDSQIVDNIIELNGGAGIFVYQASNRIKISSNQIITNTSYGINIDSGSDNPQISSNVVSGNGSYGIHLTSVDQANVTGNTVIGNTGRGINVYISNYANVSGNTVNSNTTNGIRIDNSNNAMVSGNNLYANTGSGTDSSIYLTSADNNQISDNRIVDTAGTGYAINVANSDSDTNYVADNYYTGTGATAINDAGTGSIYGGQLYGNNFVINGQGNVGIGTTSPEALLEVQGTEATNAVLALDADDGDDVADTWFLTSVASSNNLTFNNDTSAIAYLKSSGQSGGLLAIDLSTAAPSTCTEGEIYTNDTDGNIYYCTTTDTWVDLTTTGGSSTWNGITNPDGNQSLTMGAYTSAWAFDSLTTGVGLTSSSTSLTTGNLLTLSTSSTAVTTAGLLNISATGAPAAQWTGDLAKIEYNSTDADVDGSALKLGLLGTSAAGSGTTLNITTQQEGAGALALRVNDDGTYTDSTPFVIDATGNIGIGTTSPAGKLDIADTSNTAASVSLTNNTATTIGAGTNILGVIDLQSTSLTTGNFLNIELNTLTSGRGLNLTSTSTGLTSGNLANIDWSPSGSTEIFSTGDVFRINVGQYANPTNIFAIYDNGTELFSIDQAKITSALPHEFTAAGDVSVAYDLILTNQTSSKIEAYGPLTIEGGESFENNNITLKTYGTGNFIFDNGTTTEMFIDGTNDRVGIGTTSPSQVLDVNGRIRMATWTADGDAAAYQDTATNSLALVTSDRRLKKDIVPLNGALDIISQVGVYKYHDLDDEPGSKLRIGMMSQEVLPIAPELTFKFTREGSDESYYGVHYDKMSALAVLGIKEQQVQIKTLQKITDSIQTPTNIGEPLKFLSPIEVSDITVGSLKANTIDVSGISFAQKVDVDTVEEQLASIDARVVGLESRMDGVEYEIAQLKDQIASMSAQLDSVTGQLTSWTGTVGTGAAVLGASGSANLSENIASLSGLLVDGKTTTFDLSVLGSINAGLLEIGGTSGSEINSMGSVVSVQALAQGGIEFVGGKLTIDTDGNLTTIASVSADTVESREIIARKTGEIAPIVGEGVITSGLTQITITNTNVTANSKIFVTATTSTGGQPLIVKSKTNGSFIVAVESVWGFNIKFDYWILGVK